jgi:hypothetical protein
VNVPNKVDAPVVAGGCVICSVGRSREEPILNLVKCQQVGRKPVRVRIRVRVQEQCQLGVRVSGFRWVAEFETKESQTAEQLFPTEPKQA